MEVISKNIRHLRQLKGLTQEELAEALQVPRSRIGSYEEDRSSPTIEMLIKYSDYFKLPVDSLIKHDLTKARGTSFLEIDHRRVLFPIMVEEHSEELAELL